MPRVVVLYFFRLGASEGGAERMLLRLAANLVQRGHVVHVVSWDAPNQSPDRLRPFFDMAVMKGVAAPTHTTEVADCFLDRDLGSGPWRKADFPESARQ